MKRTVKTFTDEHDALRDALFTAAAAGEGLELADRLAMLARVAGEFMGIVRQQAGLTERCLRETVQVNFEMGHYIACNFYKLPVGNALAKVKTQGTA